MLRRARSLVLLAALLAAFAPASAQADPRDDHGGKHEFALGGDFETYAACASPAAFPIWDDWDIARGVAFRKDSDQTKIGGYTADGFGGIHPWGCAPALASPAYWPGWNIVRGLAIYGSASNWNGWKADAWGGMHVVGSPAAITQNAPPYWTGWDIVRGIAISDDGACGLTLDGYGGLHAWGTTTCINLIDRAGAPYWGGWDIARGIIMGKKADNRYAGYIVDAYGGLHAFGNPDWTYQMTDWTYEPGFSWVRGATHMPDKSGTILIAYWGDLFLGITPRP